MATIANPFQNRENYAKYLVLYFEPGLTVLLTTLEWCYKGQWPIEEHLARLGATNTLRKKNRIYATEQNTLEELKDGNIRLIDLDISLIYKIIQLTCDLLPRNDVVWTNACPLARQGDLEFLLFQVKDGRNKLAHPRDDQKNITDSMVAGQCKEMKDLLTKLLQAAALKANIDLNSSEFNKINKHCEDDVQRILKGENVCDSMSNHTLDLILTDLKVKHFINNELKATFMKEIDEYSAPSLKDKDGFHPLKDILQLNKSPVIVVQGEAGMGKTTMSRFLFYAWLSGKTDPVEELSSFDMVLRVDCNDILSSDIHLFYETLLPSASFAFPNTNSLKRSLDKCKTLWIMDGFDESRSEFKGFLSAMIKSLSEKHKLLITTRPHTYEDLKKYFCKHSSLTLELLQDHNVDKIIQSLITEDKKKETFKTHFKTTLDEAAKDLLRNPLNLNLYINLWIQDPELVRDTYTTKLLYLKTIYHNLSLLPKRLDRHSDLSSEDLKESLKDWLYGSLCKQSFLMLMKGRLNIISKEVLDTLKTDARNFTQNTSMCLSTFLVQEKNYDWEDKGEFRYEFHHLTQQYILASLFLKRFKDYDGEDALNCVCNSVNFYAIGHFTTLKFLEFYVEMIKEDCSLVDNFTDVFPQIQKMINLCAANSRSNLWFTTSVASNFNEKYMENVSQAFEGIPYLDIDEFENLFDLAKFLEIVLPRKIVISNIRFAAEQEGFQALLDVLKNRKIEIEFQNIIPIAVKASRMVHVTDHFCDTFVDLLRVGTSYPKELKKVCVPIKNYGEFRQLIIYELPDIIVKCKALEHLEIWINFNSFVLPHPDRLHCLPKEIIEITTLGLVGLDEENFDVILGFLIKVKDDDASMFKALYHDFVDISETNKQQLQQVANTVSIDFVCQCKKDVIEKIDKLNITSFFGLGDIQMLNALNAHHPNLKSVFLKITFNPLSASVPLMGRGENYLL